MVSPVGVRAGTNRKIVATREIPITLSVEINDEKKKYNPYAVAIPPGDDHVY
jgi:hypothetical protein